MRISLASSIAFFSRSLGERGIPLTEAINVLALFIKPHIAGWVFFLIPFFTLSAVELGVDVFFSEGHDHELAGKRVGLITNHTGVNRDLVSTVELCKCLNLKAIFSPEHGFAGNSYAFEAIKDGQCGTIPVYSLHGKTRRPTKEMLDNVDIILYDIQDVGVRCYTYITTLFYVMEECALRKIPVIVFDRPNPIGGDIVDGTMLDPAHRAFASYINVAYCHGMTIGELARYFNEEYKIHCSLTVIPMKGWKRHMDFAHTGLQWIPTSPHIPEETTPIYYATTGLIGELGVISIGVGYTTPFKIIGAPWVNGATLTQKMNELKLKGVTFVETHFRPFYGLYKGENCHGFLIRVTDRPMYKPAQTQFAIIGMLKSLYPKEMGPALTKLSGAKSVYFSNAVGTADVAKIIVNEKYVIYKLIGLHRIERDQYIARRQKYLLY
ncbi:MAG: DUF1343 domain-containing protein [Simkaniaceae bacterium]|nr:DUF1343 domain-containing protein [Simkaniaceae bacterium]